MATTPGNALRDCLDALGKKDIAALDRGLAKDHPVLWIGTDPDEWWADRARILEVFEIQLGELGGPSVDVGEITEGEAGDGGWAAAQMSVSIPDGPTLAMRATAACVREDGEWRVVQCHCSIGAANEEALGTELTT